MTSLLSFLENRLHQLRCRKDMIPRYVERQGNNPSTRDFSMEDIPKIEEQMKETAVAVQAIKDWNAIYPIRFLVSSSDLASKLSSIVEPLEDWTVKLFIVGNKEMVIETKAGKEAKIEVEPMLLKNMDKNILLRLKNDQVSWILSILKNIPPQRVVLEFQKDTVTIVP